MAWATFSEFTMCNNGTMYNPLIASCTCTHWLRARAPSSGVGEMDTWVEDQQSGQTVLGPVKAKVGACLTTTGQLNQGVHYNHYGKLSDSVGGCGYMLLTSTDPGLCGQTGPGGE